MIRKSLVVSVALSLFSMLCLADDMQSHFSRATFTLGTSSLPYRCAEICHNDGDPALVMYLHGGSSRGDDNSAQLNEAAVGVIYQYLVDNNISATFIVPQCPAGGGWTGPLRRVVNELLKSFVSAGTADADRVYVLGGSMGGTGTWCQLSNSPDFYAAAMPVAGNPSGCEAANVATTPVYTVMGSADNIMSIDVVEQFQSEVVAAGGTFRLDVETGWTHQNTCELSYTDSRLDWLFSQRRNSGGVSAPLIEVDVNHSQLYNIQGVAVSADYKGIVVKAGKKFLNGY